MPPTAQFDRLKPTSRPDTGMPNPPNEPTPTPFDQAHVRITPLCQAYGFRLLLLERPERGQPHGFAEFSRGDVRLRLVWEGVEKAIWLEAARQRAGEIVGRWTDIEWSLAGERLPLDREVGEARMERLEFALAAFVLQSFPESKPA